MKATCKVETCDEHGRTRGLCAGHYTRLRKTGDVQAHIPIVRRPNRKPKNCTVDTCADPAIAKGLCATHRYRQQRHGSTDLPESRTPQPKPPCEVATCNEPILARELCSGHYNRLRTLGDVQADKPLRLIHRNNGATCGAKDCDRRATHVGMCSTHRYRVTKTGDAQEHLPILDPKRGRKPCSVDDCDNKSSVRGWCPGHWARWKKYGDVLAHIPLAKRVVLPPGTICSVETCPRPARVKGWCNAHYRRDYDTGDLRPEKPLLIFRRPGDLCSVATCDEPALSRTWCHGHYYRHRRTGDVMADKPLFKVYAARGGPCIKDGCDRPATGRGMCSRHYSAWALDRIRADPALHARYKEYQRAAKKREYQRDPNAPRDRARRWRRANPAKFRAIQFHHRKRRERATRLPFTDEQLNARMAYWGSRCWVCHGPFQAVDHVKPVVAGGWHALMNLRPICRTCNSSRGGRWKGVRGLRAA